MKKLEDQSDYDQLAQFWLDQGESGLAAENLRLHSSETEPNAQGLADAGEQFLAILGRTDKEDEAAMNNYMFRSIWCYEQAMEMDSLNVPSDWKVNLAKCYTDYRGDVMKGVFLLREAAAEDPQNAEAQLRLGRFALMSGQNDRAIQRFETVLDIDSLNLRARLFLAQTLDATGDLEASVETLNEGLRIHQDSLSLSTLRTAVDNLNN